MPRPHPVRRRDGTIAWRVRFRLDGGGNPVSETFDDEDAAARFARLVERVGGSAARRARDMTGAADSATPTLAAAVDDHISRLAASVTPRTLADYRRIAEARIIPALGTTPVDLISRATVERWVASLREETIAGGSRAGRPLSAKTLRSAHTLLSSALQRCVDDGVIPSNVARGVRLPRDRATREMRFLTPGEFARLLDAIPPHYRTLVATLYGTGARFGEATALTPASLDLDGDPPTLRVTQAWKSDGAGGYYLGPPKTTRSVRTITLPRSLVPELRAAAAGKRQDDLVLTTTTGRRISQPLFWRKAWRPAVDAAGLEPRPRVHDLRHSHASALIAAGIPLPVIQRRLGHESIQTTVDVYGHLAPESYAGAAAAMDASLVQALPQIEA